MVSVDNLKRGLSLIFEGAKLFVNANAFLTLFGISLVQLLIGLALYSQSMILYYNNTIYLYVIFCLTTLWGASLFLSDLKYRRFSRTIQKMIDKASELSLQNANSDKEIFEKFRSRIPSTRSAPTFHRDTSLIVRRNITEILDATAILFKFLTRDDCNLTIKYIIKSKDTKTLLKTAHRDSACENRRGARGGDTQFLEHNKEIEEIYLKRLDCFGCDDLKKLCKEGKYHNSRNDWRDYYNATIVMPIRDLESPTDVTMIICVDNFKGGLNNHLARSLCRYIANRISVMEYRLAALGGSDR